MKIIGSQTLKLKVGHAMAQKNFSLPDKFVDWFESWCNSNGYTQTTTVQAALHKFSQMSHSDRIKWFENVGSIPRETTETRDNPYSLGPKDDQSECENEA